MNKIYKVVWNKARNCYVVASEFAKNQGKASSAKRILAVLVAAGSIGGTISGVQAANNITETKTPPQMIGYKQKWDTDVKNGKLGTSIDGWQYQGNSLQLNSLNFEKYTTQKGENGLAIRLGANVDGINKSGSLYFVDTNTKNTALSTVIDDKGNIKLTVTDSDNKKVESTVNISNYVQSEVNKKSEKHSSVSTTDKNLSIDSTGTNNAGGIDYKVSLKNDLKLGSVTTGDTKMNTDGVKVGENVSLTKDGLTAGDTKVTNAGLSIGDKTYVSKDGLNANNQTITNVAAGTEDTDAVNVAQLKKVSEAAANANKGWKLKTTGGTESVVAPGATVEFDGDDNIQVGNVGNKVSVTLKDTLTGITSITGAGEGAGSISFADGGIKLNNKVTINKDGKITGVAAGVEKTDAVNVGQLTDYVAANDTHIKSGNYAVGEVTDSTGNKSQGVSMDIVNKEGKVTGTVTITDVAKASDVGEVNNIDSDIKNQNSSHTTVVDAVNNLNQKLNNKVGDLNYVEGGKGNYVTNGENTTTSIGKLDQALKDVAATAAKHTTVTQGDNITVTPGTNTDGSKNYNVALKKDITVESVTANTFKADQTVMNKDGLKVGNKVSVSATAVTAGKTSISDEGVKVGGKTYISDKGLNANDQKVTNVAAGELSATSKDAVNGSQLYETNQAIANNATNISSLSHSISNLDNRVNKVGAGAAALAALHPLDFDPDAKWDFAAGYGNYRGANAAAVGAYYRPNEDTMFSVGGTFGNGENMVNAGVNFKLGSGSSHVSTSRVAMAKEIKELRGELEAMKSAMLDANAGKKIDTSKLQLFPDVPQNHWAYEYVAQLAGNGMIEGYPDGNFAGDRPMTRYEFAAILYRAMTKGAVLSDKILSEFSHELEYFTVDTIAKDKAGNPTIQRVRIVKENKNK